jgi:hypothetical protein
MAYWQVRKRVDSTHEWLWATAHGWTPNGVYAYKFGSLALAQEFAGKAGAEVFAHGQ